MSQGSFESGIGRRDMLCSGGSAVFSSLIAALLGDVKPARAQTISGSVPEVDRAAIRVVIDNYHFALSPSGKIGDVEVERIGFPLSDKPPGKVLMSEFGLSMHLETRRANETRNVLIDFGYSSPTLLNNLDILGIDPAKLDAMVLSHGHYDHFGGMVGFLSANSGTAQAEAAAVYRRRGMLLFTSVHCRADAAQFRGTRSQRNRGGGPVRHYRRRTGGDRRPCLRYWSHRARDVRTGAIANPDESRDRQRPWLFP